jgi:hypothetical protein
MDECAPRFHSSANSYNKYMMSLFSDLRLDVVNMNWIKLINELFQSDARLALRDGLLVSEEQTCSVTN